MKCFTASSLSYSFKLNLADCVFYFTLVIKHRSKIHENRIAQEWEKSYFRKFNCMAFHLIGPWNVSVYSRILLQTDYIFIGLLFFDCVSENKSLVRQG